MVLFYRMPYVAFNYRIIKEGMTPQEAVDSADCLKLMGLASSEATAGSLPLRQCHYRDAFPNGECRADHGNAIFLNYTDVKMRSVASRKEAFDEIKSFMEVNEIQTNGTIIRNRDEELTVTLFYSPKAIGKELGRQVVRFSLLYTDDPDKTPSPCVNNAPTSVRPSKPDRYIQKYLDLGG